jgi:hypothetical protein
MAHYRNLSNLFVWDLAAPCLNSINDTDQSMLSGMLVTI